MVEVLPFSFAFSGTLGKPPGCSELAFVLPALPGLVIIIISIITPPVSALLGSGAVPQQEGALLPILLAWEKLASGLDPAQGEEHLQTSIPTLPLCSHQAWASQKPPQEGLACPLHLEGPHAWFNVLDILSNF